MCGMLKWFKYFPTEQRAHLGKFKFLTGDFFEQSAVIKALWNIYKKLRIWHEGYSEDNWLNFLTNFELIL